LIIRKVSFIFAPQKRIDILLESTTLKQLDDLLTSLYNHRSEKHFTFTDIAELIQEEHSEIAFGDILFILSRLERDGYILYDDRAVKAGDQSFSDRVYRITFDGKYWIERGGYQAALIHENAGNRRLGKLETTQIQYQIWLIWLTVILAVGTLIASLYYITELYWNHGWFHLGK